MSCEESYLAIIRYLTDEREPYAPGTPGNTKRKIRKAAACYVVRDGTLFYQRRQKGQNAFTELEVVLEDSRRRELIDEAHIPTEGGEHLNQQLTWETLSQKYWWRGNVVILFFSSSFLIINAVSVVWRGCCGSVYSLLAAASLSRLA